MTMRLGASLRPRSDDPEQAALAYARAGYAAAVCPPVSIDQPERIGTIRDAFARHNITVAEVGVWNNMMDPDQAKRAANLDANVRALAVADAVGALCCVNIAGSFSPTEWDGPHPKNLSQEAFDLTVQNVRHIVDAVKPVRCKYAIEPMPWVIPDSPDSYLKLLQAVDRPAFAAHLDPVNMINCPQRYYQNADFLRECFAKLGRWIVSCHAKDTIISDKLTVHLAEARPGLGALDYTVFLREVSRLPIDTPVIIEHLPADQYPAARDYVLSVAKQAGLAFVQPRV
jgi:sugar phosphate isomerase/epimerase